MKDISVGARTTESFATANSLLIDFKIEILTAGTWPKMGEATCVLPREMKVCTEKFERWYKNANANRQLTWLNTNGSVEVLVLKMQKQY